MVTAKMVCGAECGIADVGANPPAPRHWSSASSPIPTVVTSGPSTMRSARCFRFNAVSDPQSLTHSFGSAISSPATVVGRFYIYFTTLPNADGVIFKDGSLNYYLRYSTGVNHFILGCGGASHTSTWAPVTGRWYRIDFKYVMATASSIQLMVDGVVQDSFSDSVGDSAASSIVFGDSGSGTGADYYLDDIIISDTSADYPIGEGKVVGLYPNGDKTNSSANPTDGNGGHLYSAIGDFQKGSAAGTNLGAQNAEATSWQSLANPLSVSIGTNYIADRLGSSTEHLVWTHDAMPTDVVLINGVMVVAAAHSATTATNNEKLNITDSAGANALSIFSLSPGNTTPIIPVVMLPNAPGGSAWTKALLDACLIRWGDSSDISPVPFLDGVCLEVDYQPSPLWVPYAVTTRV